MTQEQKKFILDNRLTMHTNEIAAKLKVTEGCIIGFLFRKGLPRRIYRKFEKTRTIIEQQWEPQRTDRTRNAGYTNVQHEDYINYILNTPIDGLIRNQKKTLAAVL